MSSKQRRESEPPPVYIDVAAHVDITGIMLAFFIGYAIGVLVERVIYADAK